jgi:hypothetical protein
MFIIAATGTVKASAAVTIPLHPGDAPRPRQLHRLAGRLAVGDCGPHLHQGGGLARAAPS